MWGRNKLEENQTWGKNSGGNTLVATQNGMGTFAATHWRRLTWGRNSGRNKLGETQSWGRTRGGNTPTAAQTWGRNVCSKTLEETQTWGQNNGWNTQ